MININRLTKKFDEKIVLDSLSFDIAENSCFGIMGRNGAGKTSLFKILLSEIDYEGDVLINKLAPNEFFNKFSSKIFFVGDTPVKYNFLTGYEFFEFIRQIKKVVNVDKEFFYELLELMGLKGYENKLIGTYSYGMYRKLLLIISIVIRPKLLILDEPTIGLDVAAIQILKRILKSPIVGNTTLLIASHDVDFISEVCGEIILIDKGKIIHRYKNAEGQRNKISDDIEYMLCK